MKQKTLAYLLFLLQVCLFCHKARTAKDHMKYSIQYLKLKEEQK